MRTGTSRRSKNGQALVESAAGMIIISMLVVGSILLILACGYAVYYKIKIENAATAGARYGVDSAEFLGAPKPNYSEDQLDGDVTAVVNSVLMQTGMPAASQVDVERVTSNGIRLLKVSVKVDGLKIISGGIFPSQITLCDSSAAPFSNSSPIAVVGLTIGASPNGQGVYLPCYGTSGPMGTAGNTGANSSFHSSGSGNSPMTRLPAGNYPYYAAGVQSLDSNSMNGPYQSSQPNGTFHGY